MSDLMGKIFVSFGGSKVACLVLFFYSPGKAWGQSASKNFVLGIIIQWCEVNFKKNGVYPSMISIIIDPMAIKFILRSIVVAYVMNWLPLFENEFTSLKDDSQHKILLTEIFLVD